MKKLLIFDGVDNAGKTWLITELCKKYPELGHCKFPSKELANKPIFHEITVNPTKENRHLWLHTLIEDIYETIRIIPNDIILVDRMWYSTLIYQGDGIDGKFPFEWHINKEYTNLMARLGIAAENVCHILFGYPLCGQSKLESNPTKVLLDTNQKQTIEKTRELTYALLHSQSQPIPNPFWNDYLNQTQLYVEAVLAEQQPCSLACIQDIQQQRFVNICYLIEALQGKCTLPKWDY